MCYRVGASRSPSPPKVKVSTVTMTTRPGISSHGASATSPIVSPTCTGAASQLDGRRLAAEPRKETTSHHHRHRIVKRRSRNDVAGEGRRPCGAGRMRTGAGAARWCGASTKSSSRRAGTRPLAAERRPADQRQDHGDGEEAPGSASSRAAGQRELPANPDRRHGRQQLG